MRKEAVTGFGRHFRIFEEEISQDVGVSWVDSNVVKKGRDIGHEEDFGGANAQQDVVETVDKIGSAKKLVVKADAVDRSARVMARACLSLLFDNVDGEIPHQSFNQLVDFLWRDFFGKSVGDKLFHVFEDAPPSLLVASEAGDH